MPALLLVLPNIVLKEFYWRHPAMLLISPVLAMALLAFKTRLRN